MIYINKIIILFAITFLFPNYQDFTNAFIDVSKQANPSVVSIISQKETEFNNPFLLPYGDLFPKESYKSKSLGSGVIIDSKNGYIITNSHVISKSDEIKVLLYDKRELEAKIVGEDPLSDIAIIKIDSDNLIDLEFGDSNELEVGQWIIAIGSPFGLHLNHTVTAGIISAVGRSDVISKMNYENFIQHDAAINPGNSGGALLDLEGNLIGINTAIATDGYSKANAGIGFAIPINQAKKVANDLIENGIVKRGWLGVTIQDITKEMKTVLNLKEQSGALISQVLKNSPASNAGLKIEDVIIKVNNIDVKNSSHLRNVISDEYPKQKITITIIRNNKEKKIKVLLGERPNNKSLINGNWEQSNDFDILGIKIENIDSKGVRVIELEPGSTASVEGVRKGDIIESVGRHIIRNQSDYFNIIKNYNSGDTIMLRVIRNNNARYIAFKIK